MNFDTQTNLHMHGSVTFYQFPYVMSSYLKNVCHAVQVTVVSITTKIIVVKCFITYRICEIIVIFVARNSENEFKCGILDRYNCFIVTNLCLTLYRNIWWNENNACNTPTVVLASLDILNFGQKILALLLCKNRNDVFIFIFRVQLFEAQLSYYPWPA